MNNQIRARVASFVDDLSDLIRDAALQAVEEALGGRGTRRVASTRPTAPSASGASSAPRRGPGRPRSTPLVDPGPVLVALKAAGGPVPAGRLAAELGTDTNTLRPTLEALMASGHVKRAGKKRGTTYQAVAGGGGGASRAPAKKKAGRKKASGGGGGKSVSPEAALAALQKAGGPVRSENLAATLGTDSSTLRPTLEGLMATGHIKREGVKRATTYEAVKGGGGGSSVGPTKKKKASKKKAGRKKTSKK